MNFHISVDWGSACFQSLRGTGCEVDIVVVLCIPKFRWGREVGLSSTILRSVKLLAAIELRGISSLLEREFSHGMDNAMSQRTIASY